MHGASNTPRDPASHLRLVGSPPLDIDLPDAMPLASRDACDAAFDALTDLFLGQPAPRLRRDPVVAPTETKPEPREAARVAPVEVLVLGHLPVRAAPWCTQHARRTALDLMAPVALVRLASGQLSVDLYGPVRGDVAPAATAEDAMRSAHGLAARWIVQADEVDQPALASHPLTDEVTLLTGVNDAAIVGAYRTLKGLAADGIESDHAPDVTLVLAGVPEDEAASAAERLSSAARLFLERPVQIGRTLPRIDSARGVSLFRGPSPWSAGAIIDQIHAARTPAPHRSSEGDPSPPSLGQDLVTRPEPRKADAGPPTLTTLVPGLRPLAARSPEDRTTELALDERGRLHLLRIDDGQQSYERLSVVLAWARRHGELLALTAGPEAVYDASALPVAHLFTQRPRDRRPLLDAEVKVHALTPPAQTWAAMELN